MNNILIVDADRAHLDKIEKMLTPFRDRYAFSFLQYPEEALDVLENGTIDVLISELDMPVMSGRELFDMTDIISPATVKIAMNEVKDVSETVQIMNDSRVFKLILKPFRFVEDILEPIEKAVAYKNINKQNEQKEIGTAMERELMRRDYHNLEELIEMRGGDYESVGSMLSGLAFTNLTQSEDTRAKLRNEKIVAFWEECFQEYIMQYIFSQKNPRERLHELDERLNASGMDVTMIKKCVAATMQQSCAISICYAIFLMARLCRRTFSEFAMAVQIEEDDHFYKIKMICSYQTKNNLIEQDQMTRAAMYQCVRSLMDKLFLKSVLGTEDNPYTAVVVIKKRSLREVPR